MEPSSAVTDSPEPVAPPPAVPPLDTARDAGPPSRWTSRRKLALGLAGGSAAAGAAGIVLGLHARSRERDGLALCPGGMSSCLDARRADQLLDEGAHRALAANLVFGAAAALAIGAGALWFTGAPDHGVRGVAIIPGVSLVGPL